MCGQEAQRSIFPVFLKYYYELCNLARKCQVGTPTFIRCSEKTLDDAVILITKQLTRPGYNATFDMLGIANQRNSFILISLERPNKSFTLKVYENYR